MQHVGLRELLVQLVDAGRLDPAACRARDERLRARADGPVERLALAPALVARLPEVEDGIVARQHREAAVMVENLEAEPARGRTSTAAAASRTGSAGIVWVSVTIGAARCRACRAARGSRPASCTKRTSSSIFCSVSVVAPAAWKISSRTTVPWTSFAPKWSATAASGIPIMIQ